MSLDCRQVLPDLPSITRIITKERIAGSITSAMIFVKTIKDHNTALKSWQYVYNTVRPHQALGYKTPLQKLHEFDIFPDIPPPSFSHMS